MSEIIISDPDFKLWLLISKARHFILKARKRELKPYFITPLQVYVLFIISRLGHEATLTEIARHVNREINSVSMLISRMEKDGLIKKVRVTPKSTLIRFEITKQGLETCSLTANGEVYKIIFSVLSDEERRQFTSIMNKIITKADELLSTQS